jgi:hypothetical protein
MSQHPKNDPKATTEIDKRKTDKDELSEQELDKASGGGISLPYTKVEVEYTPQRGA